MDGPACNDNLRNVSRKFQDPDYMQLFCYTCSFYEADDGTIIGNENCRDLDEAEVNVDVLIAACPTHAQMGCYTGAALHDVVS